MAPLPIGVGHEVDRGDVLADAFNMRALEPGVGLGDAGLAAGDQGGLRVPAGLELGADEVPRLVVDDFAVDELCRHVVRKGFAWPAGSFPLAPTRPSCACKQTLPGGPAKCGPQCITSGCRAGRLRGRCALHRRRARRGHTTPWRRSWPRRRSRWRRREAWSRREPGPALRCRSR